MADSDSQEGQLTGQGVPEAYFRLRFEKFSGFVEQCSSSISLVGMFLRTRQPKPIGTRIGFELKLADGFRLLRGVGEVAWVVAEAAGRKHPPGMGVRFLTLDESGRELIQRIVDEHVKGGGEAFAVERPPADAETGEAQPDFDLSEDPTLLVGRALLPVADDEAGEMDGERPMNRLGAPWGERLPDLPPDFFDGAAEAPAEQQPLQASPGEGGEMSFELALEAADEVAEAPGFALPATGLPTFEEAEEPLPDFDFQEAEPEPPAPARSPRTLEQELAELRMRLAQEVAAPVEPPRPMTIQPWDVPPAPVAPTVPEVPLAPMLPPAQSSAELAGSVDSWSQAAAEEEEEVPVPPRRQAGKLVALLLLLLLAAGAYVFRQPLLEMAGFGSGAARPGAATASAVVAERPSPAPAVPEESVPELTATAPEADEIAPEHIAVGPEADAALPVATSETPAAAAAPELPKAAAAPPAVPATAATRITAITWRKTAAGTEVLLQADGRLDAERYSHARFASPERELVKVRGIASPYGMRQLAVGTDELRQVRVGFHERAGGAELHVVLDLAGSAVELRDIRNLGDRLELVLR